jgi:hypothetical protein
MIKDKAYWNMHRIMERILTWCDSETVNLTLTHPPSQTSEVRVRSTSIMTPGGKIIRIIRKPSEEM